MQTNIHLWSYHAQFFLEWKMFQKKVVENINLQSVSDRIGLSVDIMKVFFTHSWNDEGAHPCARIRLLWKKYPPHTRGIIFKRRRKAHKKCRHIRQHPIRDQQPHFAARCEHNQQQQNKQIQQIGGTYTWRVRSNTYCHGHQTHSLPVREKQIYIIFGYLHVTLRRLCNGLHINNISYTVCRHDYNLSPH